MRRPPLPVRLLPPLLALLAPTAALAATLPVQGVLRTAGGGPVADGSYVLIPALYASQDAQQPVWQELQKKVEVGQGFFAFELGSQAAVDPALLQSGQPLWLGIQVAGTDELPRVPLGWVARAWHAQAAASGLFPYAASTQPGGPATALQCSGCVTGEMLAAGSVAADHVAFGYAGAAQKGGPATEALHALAADTAKQADAAKKADTAATAEELACTGCVGLGHLAKDVAQGFVSTQGGTVDGKLAVTQGLDLGESTISGGRFQAVDVAQAPCGAAQLGRLVVDAGSQKLFFCNGQKYQQILVCSGECKQAALVACGQPVTDDCGNLAACTGKGSACPPGESCVAGKCSTPGSSPESAAKSCAALLAAVPDAADGVYWLDFDGAGGANPAQYPCDMKNGGWTRVALDDFEKGAAGWNPASTTSCGAWGTILGGFNVFGQGAQAVQAYAGLPAHGQVRITADWLRIDSWDGETASLSLDGKQVWSQALSCCDGDQVCGVGSGWGDEKWPVVGEMAHTAAKVEVRFSSTLDQGSGDESWGVDNVAVWVK